MYGQYLKPDAIPSVFNRRSKKFSSTESRKSEIEARRKKRELELKEADMVSLIDGILDKVSKSKESHEILNRFTILKSKDHLAI